MALKDMMRSTLNQVQPHCHLFSLPLPFAYFLTSHLLSQKKACDMSIDPIQHLGAAIEIYAPLPNREPILHAVFDFDGTLSLIRAGWQEVMLAQCVEELEQTPTREDRDTLGRICNEFITQLTGRQTIYQMIRLAEEVVLRGGTPRKPREYKWQYLDRLQKKIAHRIADLERGAAKNDYRIRGSTDLLDDLLRRGTVCHLASGTDEQFVIAEAKLLGLDHYFADRIYGARDDYQSFSKQMLVERICADHDVRGGQLAVFGDGYVEIEAARSAGGIAVGIASLESVGYGWDPWKKERLCAVGTHVLVPDWRESELLLSFLCGESDV